MEIDEICMRADDSMLLLHTESGLIGFTDEGREYYAHWFRRYGHVLLPHYNSMQDWVYARSDVMLKNLEEVLRHRAEQMTNPDTLKRIADELGVSEKAAVQIAINRLHFQLFSEAGQDYPTKEQVAQVNEAYGELKDPTTTKKSITD